MTRTREAKETDGLTKAITKSRSKPINNCRDGNDRPHITLLFNGQYNLTAEFKQFWRENSLSAMSTMQIRERFYRLDQEKACERAILLSIRRFLLRVAR